MTKRDYHSPLREEQAAATRDRILAAAAEQFGESGWQHFSMARVAERAGVSHRTVYRYFPERDALLDGLREWYETHLRVDPPRTIDDLIEIPVPLFELFDDNASVVLALLNSDVATTIGGPARARRLRDLAKLLEPETGPLEPAERRRVLAAVRALLSSHTWKTLREELDMDGTEAGEAVSWALRALMGDVRRRVAARR